MTRICPGLASCAAGMVLALSLLLPSGYSWGAMLMLFAAFLSIGTWFKAPLATGFRWQIASFLIMCVGWQIDMWLSQQGARGMDKPLKYLLAIPCVCFVARFPPKENWLWLGAALGGMGGGAIALFQYAYLHLPRPHGFTNAIQFGNLSLLMGLICVIGLAVPTPQRATLLWKLIFIAGGFLGFCGSVLSQSRGGWLALLLLIPILVMASWRYLSRRNMALGAAIICLPFWFLTLLPGSELPNRIHLVLEEVSDYNNSGSATTSLGQRLEHWKLAYQLGLEKPGFGWTQKGYETAKQQRAAAGLYHPSIVEFNHAHNEFLDAFAKRGGMGLAMLLFLYAVPCFLFWPRKNQQNPNQNPHLLALQLFGLSIPLAYFGFGITQVFLGHNSGTMFFLFVTISVYACLQHQQRGVAT